MSESQGVSQSSANQTATDNLKTNAGRKGETRTFDQPTQAQAAPTNLEAVQGALTTANPFEMTDAWRDAFAPLLSAQLEAGRWFDNLWRQTTGLGALAPLRPARYLAGGIAPALGMPAADLKETDAGYELSVELPGIPREDIELKVLRDAVRVTGQKTEERQETRADYRISERRFGRFERSFPIPPDVNREGISASSEHGVLKILMPKSESAEAGSRRVEIR